MDILTHCISGLLSGTAVGICSSKKTSFRIGCTFFGGLGGIIPDVDVISLWSGFDSSLGSWFQLTQKGREIYNGDWWYSHHNFTHSISCMLLLSVLLMGLIRCTTRKKKAWKSNASIYFSLAFALGYLAHLLQDLPTPPGPWGGIKLWWPAENYIGGYGHIWWWNNYDLFLIVLSTWFVLIGISCFKSFFSRITELRLSCIILVICSGLFIFQINTRPHHYGLKPEEINYYNKDSVSKQEQRLILGEKLYHFMENLDNKLNIYF